MPPSGGSQKAHDNLERLYTGYYTGCRLNTENEGLEYFIVGIEAYG